MRSAKSNIESHSRPSDFASIELTNGCPSNTKPVTAAFRCPDTGTILLPDWQNGTSIARSDRIASV